VTPRHVNEYQLTCLEPGEVSDLVLPLARVAEGYRAMDERRAIKTLLRP
jgi:hypothetical protein